MSNKYQEALDNVMKDNPKAKLTISDIHKDIRLLLELVLKETPKKPTITSEEVRILGVSTPFPMWYRYCPSCRVMLNPNRYERPNYCSSCGQKLDWSD